MHSKPRPRLKKFFAKLKSALLVPPAPPPVKAPPAPAPRHEQLELNLAMPKRGN
jgi:hypothetical protein